MNIIFFSVPNFHLSMSSNSTPHQRRRSVYEKNLGSVDIV